MAGVLSTRTVVGDVVFWTDWSGVGHMSRWGDVSEDDIRDGEGSLATGDADVEDGIDAVWDFIIDVLDEIESHVVGAVFDDDDVFEVSSNLTESVFLFG